MGIMLRSKRVQLCGGEKPVIKALEVFANFDWLLRGHLYYHFSSSDSSRFFEELSYSVDSRYFNRAEKSAFQEKQNEKGEL
jgi:hypothetical protein